MKNIFKAAGMGIAFGLGLYAVVMVTLTLYNVVTCPDGLTLAQCINPPFTIEAE